MYYYGTHKLWIIAGRPEHVPIYVIASRSLSQVACIDERGFNNEFCFGAILCFKCGNENSDPGHDKRACGPLLAHLCCSCKLPRYRLLPLHTHEFCRNHQLNLTFLLYVCRTIFLL